MNKKKKTKIKVLLIVCAALLICLASLYIIRSPAVQSELQEATMENKIDEILNGMSTEDKVGQLFMGCFYDSLPSADEIEEYHLGAILLFKGSFRDMNTESLSKALAEIHETGPIPPLVAVDEEGGTVNRLSCYTAFRNTPFESPRKIYEKGGMDALISDAHEKNQLLSSVGIDMNLAPVCDISRQPENFMYQRSLGQDAQTTAKYASSMVKACEEDNMICVLKHFPGYGNSADTHKGLVVDQRPLSQFENEDFIPFKAGIDAGAPAVLVSHNIVSEIDCNFPASLSKKTHRLLREDMEFEGIIITDDLSMTAISQYTEGKDSAVAAVLAGNDILCTGDFKTQYHNVLAAVKDGTISMERLDESVKRILSLKMEKDL